MDVFQSAYYTHMAIPTAQQNHPEPKEEESATLTKKGTARRQQVLDRAIEVFAEKGAAATSLRAIAASLGVSHGALLHYFSSRETLMLEVLRENEARQHRIETRDDVVGPMVRAAERNTRIPGLVALYGSMLAAAADSESHSSRDYFHDRFEDLRQYLVDRIKMGQEQGVYRSDIDSRAMADLVIAASDGLQSQWLLDPNVNIAKSLMLLHHVLEPSID